MKTTVKIRVVNNKVVKVSGKHDEFIPHLKKLNPTRDKKYKLWNLDIKKLPEILVLAHKYFDNVDFQHVTKDVTHRKADTSRKIVIGAKMIAYYRSIKDSDKPGDIEFRAVYEEIIDDLPAHKQILFDDEKQKLEASRRKPNETMHEIRKPSLKTAGRRKGKDTILANWSNKLVNEDKEKETLRLIVGRKT